MSRSIAQSSGGRSVSYGYMIAATLVKKAKAGTVGAKLKEAISEEVPAIYAAVIAKGSMHNYAGTQDVGSGPGDALDAAGMWGCGGRLGGLGVVVVGEVGCKQTRARRDGRR